MHVFCSIVSTDGKKAYYASNQLNGIGGWDLSCGVVLFYQAVVIITLELWRRGMAFTFLKARGKEIGGSLIDDAMVSTAKKILNLARTSQVKFYLPEDVLCGKSLDDNEPKGPFLINDIPNNLMGLDIGPETITKFNKIISSSETVVWNGPMGVFERKGYSRGTRDIGIHLANCVENGQKVIVGGGDTSAATEKYGLSQLMTHVSTGGGSSLEL